MEMKAVIEGLKCLKEPCEVQIFSDSAYTVNAFSNGWIFGWQKNGFKRADNKPVLNEDLWRELLSLAAVHKISFNKVKGHADDEYNNICDKLATDAVKNFKN